MPGMNMMNHPHPDDQEAAMARADLYKMANYSFKLFKMIKDGDQLEGWVQAKITKAADYIASVYHYLEYEMKFSEYGSRIENSDMYTESVREQYRAKLTEARIKLDKLKKKNKKELEEGWEDMMKATKDRAEQEKKSKGTGKFDKKEIKPGVTQYTRKASSFDDGGDDKDTKKAKKTGKVKENAAPTNPDGATAPPRKGKDGQYPIVTSGPHKGKRWSPKTPGPTNPAMKEGKKPDFLDMDKDGNKKEPMKKAIADKKKNPFAKVKETAIAGAPAAKKTNIPTTATTTVPGMRATQQDLKKANSSAALGEGKCNHTAKGKSCPVHGLKECGSMYEAKGSSASKNALKGLSGAAALYFGGSAIKQAAKMATDKPKDPNAAPADPNAAQQSAPAKTAASTPVKEKMKNSKMYEDNGDPDIKPGMKVSQGTVVKVSGNTVTVKASNGDLTTMNIHDVSDARDQNETKRKSKKLEQNEPGVAPDQQKSKFGAGLKHIAKGAAGAIAGNMIGKSINPALGPAGAVIGSRMATR